MPTEDRQCVKMCRVTILVGSSGGEDESGRDAWTERVQTGPWRVARVSHIAESRSDTAACVRRVFRVFLLSIFTCIVRPRDVPNQVLLVPQTFVLVACCPSAIAVFAFLCILPPGILASSCPCRRTSDKSPAYCGILALASKAVRNADYTCNDTYESMK